jgi:hypothetical protein
MVRLQALQIALMGLVGFRPHYEPEFPQYPEELLESRSGLYVNDVQLITPTNLTAALPVVYVQQYPEWKPQAYQRNALVRVEGILYISDKATTATQNPFDGGPWSQTDVLSARLRYVMDAAVAQLINTLVATQKLEGAKTIVEETRLYHGAGNINNRIIKEGRFLGFEVAVKQVRDFAVRIRSVGIQVDTPNPDLKIYIYHSSSSVPIKVLTPGFTGAGTFAWAAVADALLTLESSAHAPGGVFVIGYYEDDVVGQMIEREMPWPNYDLCFADMLRAYQCAKCSTANHDAVAAWGRNLEIHPITVPATALNEERTLWNIYAHKYNYNANHGLNLDVVLECDITQFLQRNELLLADALHKIATVKVLELFTTTTEVNPTAEMSKLAAAYNLDNRENYTPGLLKQMNTALAALALDVKDGDSPCVPKSIATTFSVSHGAI